MTLGARIHKLERRVANAPCATCAAMSNFILSKDGTDIPSPVCPRCGVQKQRLVIIGVDEDAFYGPGGKAGWEETRREREAAARRP